MCKVKRSTYTRRRSKAVEVQKFTHEMVSLCKILQYVKLHNVKLHYIKLQYVKLHFVKLHYVNLH